MKQYQDDCRIVPFQGQAVITTHQAPPLRLPGEQLPRRWSWQPLVAIIFSISLWLSPTPTNAAITNDGVLQSANAERTAAGLPALHHDRRLDHAAAAKANDMFAQQYFSHLSPRGQRGWFWMESAGYAYTEAGENLAMDFIDSQDVVSAWMGSAGHRRNLLSEKFLDTGVATMAGIFEGKETTMIVMLFGRQSAVTSSAAQEGPEIVAPVTASTPESKKTEIPSNSTAAKPGTPEATTRLVPSLVETTPRSVPELNFTLQDPAPKFFGLAEPRVLGAKDVLGIGGATTATIGPTLSLMIMSSLAFLTGMLGLAVFWQRQSFPQPVAIQVAVQI